MDERKAFEAWYSHSISESPGMLMKHPNGEYVYLTNEWLAWQAAWEAATMAERERCAKVCEALAPNEPNCVWEAAYKHVGEDCAAAIRNYPNQDKSG